MSELHESELAAQLRVKINSKLPKRVRPIRPAPPSLSDVPIRPTNFVGACRFSTYLPPKESRAILIWEEGMEADEFDGPEDGVWFVIPQPSPSWAEWARRCPDTWWAPLPADPEVGT